MYEIDFSRLFIRKAFKFKFNTIHNFLFQYLNAKIHIETRFMPCHRWKWIKEKGERENKEKNAASGVFNVNAILHGTFNCPLNYFRFWRFVSFRGQLLSRYVGASNALLEKNERAGVKVSKQTHRGESVWLKRDVKNTLGSESWATK